MPLSAVILEMIKEYPAAEQAVVQKFYEEHPSTAGIVEKQLIGQRDLTRRYQEVGAKEKAATEAQKRYEDLHKSNQEWLKNSEKDFTDLEAERDRLKAELSGVPARQAGAPPAEGGNGGNGGNATGITPEQLQKHFETFATPLKTQISTLQKALDDAKKEAADTINRTTGWKSAMDDMVDQYYREFKEPISRETFYKWMTDNNVGDPKVAYEKMTTEKRQHAWETAKTAEITADLEKKYSASGRMPYDNGNAAPQGAIQRLIRNADKDIIPDGVTADGSGRLASLAAQELRSEGKG